MNPPFASLEAILAADPGGRGIGPLFRAGELEAAARALATARRVVLVTGFFIPAARAPETDGPPGALALGRALGELGIGVNYLTDRHCQTVLAKAGLDPLDVYGAAPLPRDLSHLVAIERPGRAADGRYYSMRGQDLSPWTEAIDSLFLNEKPPGVGTIGIGDGGNEIGMGKVGDNVRAAIDRGGLIASIVPTDHLVVAGTSNWGAWGLVAGLSLVVGKNLLPEEYAARRDLDRLVAAGGVDGITGRRESTVDGMAWPQQAAVLALLRKIVAGL